MDEKDLRFQRLCREELAYLRGGVFRIVGNAADTDDVIQTALLRAYSRVRSFHGDATLRSWVYRIAVNCAFDLLRTRKRREETDRKYTEDSADTSADPPPKNGSPNSGRRSPGCRNSTARPSSGDV